MRAESAVTTRTEKLKVSGDPAHPSISVSRYQESDETAWTEFVKAHSASTIFHTLAWDKIVRRTFDHESRALIARDGDRVTGVLPLSFVKSAFFGRSLISVPFGVYGGILTDEAPTARALESAARELCVEEGGKFVELRHLTRPPETDLPSNDLYATFIEDVPSDAEGCLQRLPRKARAEVRKCLKDEAMTIEEETIELEEFHRLFSLNKRDLGSPLFPSSLFWHVRDVLGEDRAPMLVVRRDGKILSAVMSFVYRDTIMPYYSGAAPEAVQYRANNFMYFKLMEWASEKGLKRFDFGRSRIDTGSFKFKKNQGFEPIPLHYDYILTDGAEMPSLNPSNPKYRMAKRVFRKMPLWMAQKVGSWLVKRAPF